MPKMRNEGSGETDFHVQYFPPFRGFQGFREFNIFSPYLINWLLLVERDKEKTPSREIIDLSNKQIDPGLFIIGDRNLVVFP